MLSDDLRARVNAHADREWPHVEGGDPDVNSARSVRRLTFRQGVEWAMGHMTEALRQAADDFATIAHPYEGGVTGWLRARADQIEGRDHTVCPPEVRNGA